MTMNIQGVFLRNHFLLNNEILNRLAGALCVLTMAVRDWKYNEHEPFRSFVLRTTKNIPNNNTVPKRVEQCAKCV